MIIIITVLILHGGVATHRAFFLFEKSIISNIENHGFQRISGTMSPLKIAVMCHKGTKYSIFKTSIQNRK